MGKTKKKKVKIKTSKKKYIYYLEKTFNKFAHAFYIFVEPQSVIAFIFTAGFLIWAQFQIGITRTILEVVGLLTTTWLIEVSTQNWIKAKGDSYLAKKSGSAIRNLQLIKYKIANIGNRIDATRNLRNKRGFDEIENLIQNIHKDILNSISDWADVNPSSRKIVDFFESISQKEKIIKQLKNEKESLRKEKEKISEDKTEKINKLEKEIDKKKEQISTLEVQIASQNLGNVNILSGTVSTPTESPSLSLYAPGDIITEAKVDSISNILDDYGVETKTPSIIADHLSSSNKKGVRK